MSQERDGAVRDVERRRGHPRRAGPRGREELLREAPRRGRQDLARDRERGPLRGAALGAEHAEEELALPLFGRSTIVILSDAGGTGSVNESAGGSAPRRSVKAFSTAARAASGVVSPATTTTVFFGTYHAA